MTIQLLLVKDKVVVCRTEVPLPGPEGGQNEPSRPALQRLAGIFAIAANERRLRLMVEMTKREETRFTDLLPVAVNPKLVHDCLEPMVQNGLVVHESKGSAYRLSMKGVVVVAALTRGMSEMIQAAEEMKA